MSSSALTALRLLTVISGSSGAVFAALGYMDFVAIEKIVNFGVSQRTITPISHSRTVLL